MSGANEKAAREAWGAGLPGWVATLAARCDELGSQGAAATAIGYSAGTVNQVIHKSYGGALGRVEKAVNGAFAGATVECPVLGEIKADRCRLFQNRKPAGANTLGLKLWRACRAGCPHSDVGHNTQG